MPIRDGGGGSGTTDHGTLTGLLDDDHPGYLWLAGRTGGQIIGSTVHTGGNTTDLVIEGRLILGDASTGVAFIAGRVLDIRQNTTNNSTLINIQPTISTLSGTATGTINTLLINIAGTYGYTAGTFQHRAFFFNGNITVPSGVTLSNISAGNFQLVLNETSSAVATGINTTTVLTIDGRLPTGPNTLHTATSLIGIDLKLSTRAKPTTTVFGLSFSASAGAVTGAVPDVACIDIGNSFQASATVTNWSVIRFAANLTVNPINTWVFNILADYPSRHAGLFSIGHIAVPTAYVDVAASAAANASIRVRAGTAPNAPNQGDIWNDGNDLSVYNDGVAQRLAPRILSRTTGINGATVAATTLFTVPNGRTLVVTAVVVRTTAYTSGNATMNVKGAAAGDIVAGFASVFTAAGQGKVCNTVDPQTLAPATQAVALDITASTMVGTLAVDLIGYLI